MEITGGVLSTVKVALGPVPGAGIPAASTAVPAVMAMPSVPSPAMPLMVTVRDALPEPDTLTMPAALPVV